MYTKIVVGTDLSESAAKAVTHAANLAKISGAELHLVCAFKPSLSVSIAASSLETAAYGGAEMLVEAESRLADEVGAQLKAVKEKHAAEGVTTVTHAVAGDPVDALIEVAEHVKADLIVVGNRGMAGGLGTVKRFVLGSVPNKISHHAPCSVLIVETA